MAVIGKLKTADNLMFRGIAVPPTCSLCTVYPENHNHLFFDCEFSFNILTRLLPDLNIFLLRPTLTQVFDFFEHSMMHSRLEKDFACLTASCIIYFIWKERNFRRFSNQSNNSVKVICNISNAIRVKISKWKCKDSLLARFTGI
ncbi:hypothetical protein MA16_Dca005014 [Dendrobium catenatum]|uniref:Reverse transcriptase zinc-binding domain-containing protein n=1 Tax=Dendrobium catenatum TaxID=906689 RepID=A0A2I0WGP3_9ASPA|nr:hypothetical protein MA16_Dca005014 [Dendrobium catenatum]